MSPVEPENPNNLGEPHHSTGQIHRNALESDRVSDESDRELDGLDRGLDDDELDRVLDEPNRPTEEPLAAIRQFAPQPAAREFGTHTFNTPSEQPTGQPTEPIGSTFVDDVRRNPESAPTPPAQRPGTRAPDPTSIAAGVVFFLLGGAYLLAASGHLTVNAAWTISLMFIGLGLSGVLGAALAGRRRR